MTTALRMVFDDMPNTIAVPEEFQHRHVELILLAENAAPDADAWEPDFFARTFGSIPDILREKQELPPEHDTW